MAGGRCPVGKQQKKSIEGLRISVYRVVGFKENVQIHGKMGYGDVRAI